MAGRTADKKIKSRLIASLRMVPAGSVASVDLIAKSLNSVPAVVMTLLANLTEDDRDTMPWHRIVAKGGAIGRGPHRDQQFARLVREGVPVSPAGIVQDMARVALYSLDTPNAVSLKPADPVQPQAPAGRSRSMEDRPG